MERPLAGAALVRAEQGLEYRRLDSLPPGLQQVRLVVVVVVVVAGWL